MKPFAALCLSALLLVPVGFYNASAADDAALQNVTAEFFKVSRERQPRAAWIDGVEHGNLSVFSASPQALKGAKFAPVRPFVKKDGEFYVANVSAEGDANQQPVYLYLLAKHGQRIEIVSAFHIQHGQAEKIAF